jgi:hypothetical protein
MMSGLRQDRPLTPYPPPLGGEGRKTLAVAAALLLTLSASPAARSAEGWGTITGRIVWDGPVPEREKIDVKGNKDCLAKGDVLSEELLVNPKNKGVQNVIVWLVDATDAKKALPIHPSLKDAKLPPVEIDQPCCQFIPRVVALRQGQELVFKNSASFAHNTNVHGGAKGPNFNVTLPPGARKKVDAEELPARPTPIMIECNIHGWMKAWVRVLPHPYFAVTDADGKFTIKDAPAGNWRLVVWQEKGWNNGDRTGTPIAVEAGKTTELKPITYTPPK